MLAARKFESFCVEPAERWLFAGDLSGQIAVVDIDRFAVLGEVQAHAGTIIAMAAHPRLPYFVALGVDHIVSMWRYDALGRLFPVCSASIRNIRPSNDDEYAKWLRSNSQAIAFHDTRLRIVTRSGNGGVLELDFEDDGTVHVVRCLRLHREFDLTTVRYAAGSDLVLSGSVDGEVVLSRAGETLRRWQIGTTVIHWFEHVSAGEYLVASDSCVVARLDIESSADPLVSVPFTRDDLEHVTYNPTSGRSFVSSFDRTIYEIDPKTCVVIGPVCHLPFKARWLSSMTREPSTLLVQVRNGGLYKYNVETGACLGIIKETPEALWTGVQTSTGELLLAGEGEFLHRVRIVGGNRMSRRPAFSVERVPLPVPPSSYTKRMVLQLATGVLALGRTDGTLLIQHGDRIIRRNLGAAIRDLAVHPDRPDLFVACEDGCGYRVNLDTGEPVRTFRSPNGLSLWALAHNPERHLVAFLERRGELTIVSGDDFTPVMGGLPTARAKRAKWVDADRLRFSHTSQLDEVNVVTGERWCVVEDMSNTIEDFIWDAARLYLVVASYTTTLQLHDFESGELLSAVPDQIDYSKGLMWVPPGPRNVTYPLDFLTFGRSGVAHHFRIQNARILALGPAWPPPNGESPEQ
jgi:WD40 repeat protein